MKEIINEVVKKYPKHFSQILQSKKYLAEKQWIIENSSIETNKFLEHIRSALYDETNICEYGNIRKLKSLKEGWRFCGHSSVCKCSENNQKQKISEYFHTEENDKRLQKIKETNIKKYGSISPFGSSEVREKAKNTILQKYGEENYFGTNEFKEKIKELNIENYGVSSFQKIHIPTDVLDILDNKLKFIEFARNKSIGEISSSLNVDNATIYYRLKKYQCENIVSSRSSFESELKKFLLENKIKYISNTRKVIPPYELDFYIPDQNFAIECNGDYWHSDIFKSKNYHHEKWKRCHQLDVKLIQIRETDWKLYNTLFKSIILKSMNKINISDTEKFNIKQISSTEAKPFLEKNHLQGFCSGISHWGAFDQNNKLISVMTIGWYNTSENRIPEIKRWATTPDDHYSFPELFIKTFDHIRTILNFNKVITLSINDWFSGYEYELAGFNKKEIVGPSCQYLINGKWENQESLSKEKLKDIYYNNPVIQKMFNDGVTEFEMINYLKILKYWDSGKIEWVWRNH